MSKVAARRTLLAGTFALYWVAITLWSYLFRPGGVLFPSFLFFLGWFLLPCGLSWVFAFATSSKGIFLRLCAVLFAVILFSFGWSLEQHGLLHFAGKLDSAYSKGVLSNFLSFEPTFYERSFWLAIVLLFIFSMAWPLLAHRLSPNKSFKPNSLRESA